MRATSEIACFKSYNQAWFQALSHCISRIKYQFMSFSLNFFNIAITNSY
jgi:hypothetical protein